MGMRRVLKLDMKGEEGGVKRTGVEHPAPVLLTLHVN